MKLVSLVGVQLHAGCVYLLRRLYRRSHTHAERFEWDGLIYIAAALNNNWHPAIFYCTVPPCIHSISSEIYTHRLDL